MAEKEELRQRILLFGFDEKIDSCKKIVEAMYGYGVGLAMAVFR